jgi:phage-related protein
LRRPEADFLRDDIYELRAKQQNVNLRMLYFIHGRTAVVVSHGFSKQQAKVPHREIELAIRRKQTFEASPEAHTYEGEVG